MYSVQSAHLLIQPTDSAAALTNHGKAMNKQILFNASRQTQHAVALATEKTAALRVPNGRFAWPFPVARMHEADGAGRRAINSARTSLDGFVT